MLNRMNEIISFNSEFKNSINLYLNLNKIEKVQSYIPTKSSIDILDRYLEAVENNKFQSTLLIGPYGKGKSHLLLVLLAILSMDRNKENTKCITELTARINNVDSEISNRIQDIWNKQGKFLPVIIMSTQGDLNQAFMAGLNDALKRDELDDLIPDTFYSNALETIERWEKEYGNTYSKYVDLLDENEVSTKDMLMGLSNFEKDKLELFKSIYPMLTSGSVFNPLATSEVLPMYRSVADKIVEDYGYSGIYIIFDEFSKFIEGQDKNTTGNNMKLVQDMCELANESKEAKVFITMVAHKSIKEYGKNLSSETINSFTGIEGRIEEIRFETSSKNNYELVQNAIIKNDKDLEKIPNYSTLFSDENINEYYSSVAFKSKFTYEDFKRIVMRGCYPLLPLTAYILLSISEKVAQNERTLFTFISKDEPNSMAKYVNEHSVEKDLNWFIQADLVYDYFKNIFKKDIKNEFIHNIWLNAEYAISQAKSKEQVQMLKTLATITIVNKKDELPADEKHLALAYGKINRNSNAHDVLEELVVNKLIYKKGSTNTFAFKTRAGSELKKEIKRRRELKSNNINIGKVLSVISDTNYVLPKEYNQKYSMTRFFPVEFMEADMFLQINDDSVFFDEEQFCDGKIIALFSTDDIDKSKLIQEKMEHYKNEKIVVIYTTEKFKLIKQAIDFEIIQELKNNLEFFKDNEILLTELPVFEEDLQREIEQYIDNDFIGNRDSKVYYFLDDNVSIESNTKISKVIDKVCLDYYCKTLIVNNELINKEYITSSAIKKVRKTIVESLLQKESCEKFLGNVSQTSAYATIYRALLVNTGISNGSYIDYAEMIMNKIDEFIVSCGNEKKQINVLVNELRKAPIGMRSGIIPFYLAYAIRKRNEDVIMYFNSKEVPLTPEVIINMSLNPKEYYIYVSMDDIKKEEYLTSLINLFDVEEATNLGESRISNILVCMQRWYRSLPQITKNIRRKNDNIKSNVSVNKINKLKKILQNVDANPYEAIFELLPKDLDDNCDLDRSYKQLKSIKKYLDKYLDKMIGVAIENTIKVFDRKQKEDLNHTLLNWYEIQSDMAKKGLHNTKVTNLMSCISELNSFDDREIVKKVIRIISEIYVDSWNDNSLENYIEELIRVKEEIESIGDVKQEGKLELKFSGKDGDDILRYYDRVDESVGSQLRDILEDTMDDFSELTVNDKVAILLETIENIMM
jgi:hypothetical protein